MKTFFTTFLFLSCSLTRPIAQCPHDPVVTTSNVILCPDGVDTVWTQVGDSYRWFRDGNLIPNATQQFLIVDYDNSGAYITVETTESGCSEMSPPVMVDGWTFLLPFVSHGGTYHSDQGAYKVCLNDTITFQLENPYTTNIQWTANGIPLVEDTNQLIAITSSTATGLIDYHVCGSPSICPNYTDCLGVILTVQFEDCEGTGYEKQQNNKNYYHMYPNPAHNVVNVQGITMDEIIHYNISDQLGRILQSGPLTSVNSVIPIQNLSNGIYLIQLGNHFTFKLVKE